MELLESSKLWKALLILIFLAGLLSVYYIFDPSEHSFFISCPFETLTGYYCAGCGSQRAIHHLLNFDILSALAYNPLLVLLSPLLLYATSTAIWNYAFNTSHRVKLFYSNSFIYVFFGIVVLYWVLRNIPVYPFVLLAPPE